MLSVNTSVDTDVEVSSGVLTGFAAIEFQCLYSCIIQVKVGI